MILKRSGLCDVEGHAKNVGTIYEAELLPSTIYNYFGMLAICAPKRSNLAAGIKPGHKSRPLITGDER